MTDESQRLAPLAIREPEAIRITGLGRSKFLEEVYRGNIPSVKVGRARLYPVRGLETWLQRLQDGA